MTDTTIHADWPTQLSFPGQEAAPDGPVDMFMMYVMHHAFRRDLADFAAAVSLTPVGERETWRALEARWELFATVLHNHHAGEDAGLWPLLLERAEPHERETLEAMEAEHAGIDPILESCRAGFARLAEHPDEDARAALSVRLTAARESLRRHLAHEERDAIAILQRHLTEEDWLRLEEEHFQDGATLRYKLRVLPWLCHRVPADLLKATFRRVGGPFPVLWRVTRPEFERRERMAFRHLPA
jgi:iron-sulfur cluster repair protein YtfE (RIC family)